MSGEKKYPHAEALKVAEELQAAIAPACYRIAIAGSLRRLRPMVGDIELLYVPIVTQRPDGLFDMRNVDVTDEVIEGFLNKGILEKRPNINGHFTWGSRNKLARHVASGIPVDLFGTNEANWIVSLVIRTGSKETNLALTTGAQKQGASLNAYGSGVTWSDGTVTPATSEEHVFQMCKVPYREPKDR